MYRSYTIRSLINLFLILSLCACVNEPLSDYVVVENGVKYSTFDYSNTFDCDLTIDAGRRSYTYIYLSDPDQPGAKPVRAAWTNADGSYSCQMHLPTAMIGKPLYAVIAGETYAAEVTARGVNFRVKTSRGGYDLYGGQLEPEYRYLRELRDSYCQLIPQGDNSHHKDNINLIGEIGNIPLEVKDDNTKILFSFVSSTGWNTNFLYYYYYKDDDPLNSIDLSDRNNLKPFLDKFCNDKFLCTYGWGVEIVGAASKPNTENVKLKLEGGTGGINLRFQELMQYNRVFNDGDETPTVISNHLLYYGDDIDSKTRADGVLTFPKGYKIGFILKSVKHTHRNDPAYNNANINYIGNADVNYYFTNPIANLPNKYDQGRTHVSRFWASSPYDDDASITRYMYGYEDAMLEKWYDNNNDRNFHDFLFLVSTNPKAGTDNIRSLTGDFSTVSGTLLFEDLFPTQGDYDMNDVIVEYMVTKTYRHETVGSVDKSFIENMTIEFVPVHYGANFDDYLYVRCCKADGTPLCKPVEVKFDDNLKNICKYNRRMIDQGNLGLLKRAYITLIDNFKPYDSDVECKLTDNDLPYRMIDPFIYVRNTQREVHLTGHRFAGVRDATDADLDDNQKIYRAPECNDGSGFYPWVMDIPMHTDAFHPGFVPAAEGVNILQEYLQFGQWVSSQGKEATDWYEFKRQIYK